MRSPSRSVSIIIPCLNEAQSLRRVITWAKTGIAKLKPMGYSGEIIVVDNGSTDNSGTIARTARARVINEARRGYGQAYLTGIKHAKGTIIVMGDADGTYDFRSVPSLIREIERGADLVLGSRFLGSMSPGSMPFFNRYIGNPILTGMVNLFYGSRISDSQTGYRACTRQAFRKLGLRSHGMEFASEMIIKAVGYGLKVTEVPVSYRRRTGISKLSPFRDAWRHIRSILIFSPTYALIIPGAAALITGATAMLVLLPGPVRLGTMFVDIHTMTVSVFLMILGTHVFLTGLFARMYMSAALDIRGGALSHWLLSHLSLNALLVSGLALFISAIILISAITVAWVTSGFTALARERELIAALGIGVVGVQIIFSSLLYGLLKQ